MIEYHAVMLDETGCEFGTSVEANSRNEAYDILREDYPESRCIQLESPADRKAREQDLYERANAMYDDPDLDDYDY